MAPIEGKNEKVAPSWADQMDSEVDDSFVHLVLPPDEERVDGDTKIVTHWEQQEGKKVKIVRYYKIQKIKVPKSIAKRKGWKKFGKAATDGDGPNPSNTQITDEIQMDFPREKEAQLNQMNEDQSKKLGKGFVKCRYCDMDHWSTSCPYKEKLTLRATKEETMASTARASTEVKAAPGAEGSRAYVPPSLRSGAGGGAADARRGETMGMSRSKDEANTIRVTNLPEDIQDSDIRELFQPLGRISRIFLARDKYTGASKGFAFVSFDRKEDAAKAVATVNGHGYANLILSVEWAKPSGN